MAPTTTSARPIKPDSMSVAQAAEFLSMSPRRFRILVDQGVITKAWGTGYKWDVILREYLDHMHDLIAKRETGEAILDPIAERARKDSEMADRVALQNAVTRGEQAPMALFQSALDDVISAIRARVEPLPELLVDQLVGRDRTTIMTILKHATDAVLTELSNPQPKTD
jgi:hypothetical protein